MTVLHQKQLLAVALDCTDVGMVHWWVSPAPPLIPAAPQAMTLAHVDSACARRSDANGRRGKALLEPTESCVDALVQAGHPALGLSGGT